MGNDEEVWIIVDDVEECIYCGNCAEVLHEKAGIDNYVFYDGAEVRCVDCGCPGSITMDEYDCYVNWHDEPNCDCEWCKEHPV